MPRRFGRTRAAERPKRPRLKKLRLAFVLLGLSLLGFVSFIFGIMMAVAQDLPSLENRAQYLNAENSVVLDADGERIAVLTGNERRILLASEEISPTLKSAVVAIEDERYYEHRGIDYIAVLRALQADILAGGAVQGGSTITQQFVKNALAAQNSRTILQKLREAALAYHLERQWSKDKILTEYLNSVYFGNGAYGIEAAARTYFGWNHPGCGKEEQPCAMELLPEEAALLAGIISSPAAYNPATNPQDSEDRRNLVLQKMLEQGAITQDQYELATIQPIPAPKQIQQPTEESEAPFFTSWLRQQVVDYYGSGQAFAGGLQIRTTLDLDLQRSVQEIAASTLAGIEPTASIVVLDNNTAGVKAMVAGSDYERSQFNLAVDGHRQPGSAWKPFTLTTALMEGHTLEDLFVSEPKVFDFKAPGYKKPQQFVVNNYNDAYQGTISLATATTHSDNSVYAELGLQVGTEDIAATAHQMGIESDLSTNPAMILGGLEQGVSPLEMTHAYVTLAHDGERVSGTLAAYPEGPVAITDVTNTEGDLVPTNNDESGDNEILTQPVIPPGVAAQVKGALENVVDYGTGTAANTGDYVWGKTGTTENNGDAWFCGATEEITACVWVGHPDSNESMQYDYGGSPVVGGTYPAEIWHDVVVAYESLKAEEGLDRPDNDSDSDSGYVAPVPESTDAAPEVSEPAPEESTESAPAPEPSAPAPSAPSGGDAGGISAG